ncbi:replicative DNA helicase [Evansella vedderi]|uniref:Replicative DNA helicase n=1 Tax=Evansella vedderi TaxID=38282 RepID=A0ABT9ZVZ1_9BACI|nr:replicative DNA helicase [Evansella vedderi]
MELERREFVKCSKCGFVEKRDDAVMRTIEEYILLFPDREINTQNINQWCKIVSKRTISRVLNKNFKRINHGKYSTYIKVFS